nr:adenylosuccinate synthetase [Kofleriaceae bacterium]
MTTQVQLVLGLGFGDEGKGTIVDWLARRASSPPLVIRWNGGPQAAHHVVTEAGAVHCFAQLGAASFVPGARTHLAADMAVDLPALWTELAAFARAAGFDAPPPTIDPRCALVTPWHVALGLVREAMRGAARHGSTGRGVGEAKLGPIRVFAGDLGFGAAARLRDARDALLARIDAAIAGGPDLARELAARAADPQLFDAFVDAATRPLAIRDAAPRADHVIFESAQGALLDREHGFFPHVTPSRITRRAARDAARALGLGGAPLETWGVLRAYHTRHGEGPFPTEDRALGDRLREPHNRDDGPAGRFRVGWFDAVLARHAVAFAGPIDRLAITCLDRVAALPDRAVVDRYRDATDDLDVAVVAAEPVARPVDDMAAAIAELLGRRIDVASYGPRAADKRAPT